MLNDETLGSIAFGLAYVVCYIALTTIICLTLGRWIEAKGRSRALARLVSCLFLPFIGLLGCLTIGLLANINYRYEHVLTSLSFLFGIFGSTILPIGIVTSYVVFALLKKTPPSEPLGDH